MTEATETWSSGRNIQFVIQVNKPVTYYDLGNIPLMNIDFYLSIYSTYIGCSRLEGELNVRHVVGEELNRRS
jgi:hypothetical protein